MGKTWESSATQDDNWASNNLYIWSTLENFEEYEDEYGRYWKLKSGLEANQDYITSALNDMTSFTNFGYTCKLTVTNKTCRRLVHVDDRVNNSATKSTSHYITQSLNTTDKTLVDSNVKNSNAKKQLELWYQNKFSVLTNGINDTPVTDYLVDNIWCNDRSVVPKYYNSSGSFVNNSNQTGYLLTSHTFYAGRSRLLDPKIGYRSAALECANASDKFSATSTFGNAKLTYPVGLITADEVALAGGVYNQKNEKYYLRTNGNYWTMTPSHFYSTNAYADEFNVYPTGLLRSDHVTYGRGLRPVINLSSSTLISGGDGSVEHPFTIQ